MMSMPCSFVKGTKKSSATCEFGTRSVYRCMYIYIPLSMGSQEATGSFVTYKMHREREREKDGSWMFMVPVCHQLWALHAACRMNAGKLPREDFQPF